MGKFCKQLPFMAIFGLLLLLIGVLPACVTIPDSTSPYYRFAQDECYGQASLGAKYHCAQGRWVEGPLVGTASSSSRTATKN